MIHMKETLTIYTENLLMYGAVLSHFISAATLCPTLFRKKTSSRYVRIYKIGKRNLSLKTISVKKNSRFVGV